MSIKGYQNRAGIPDVDPEWIQQLVRKHMREGKTMDANSILALLHSLGYRRNEKGASQEKTEFMLDAQLATGISGETEWEKAGDIISTVESLGYKKHWHDIGWRSSGELDWMYYDFCRDPECGYVRWWRDHHVEVK